MIEVGEFDADVRITHVPDEEVRWFDPHRGVEYVIERIHTVFTYRQGQVHSRSGVMGRKVKKDGTPGAVQTTIYRYPIPEVVKATMQFAADAAFADFIRQNGAAT